MRLLDLALVMVVAWLGAHPAEPSRTSAGSRPDGPLLAPSRCLLRS